MRIAIYARVSTDDKGQDPENQLRQLRQWCDNAGHQLVHEYVDRESGRKGVNGRKQFAALFEDAHKRQFDCVLFWSLDRFIREGMVLTILHLQRLVARGVGFHSYTEAHLATTSLCATSFSHCWPRCPRLKRRRSPSAPAPAWREPGHRASASQASYLSEASGPNR